MMRPCFPVLAGIILLQISTKAQEIAGPTLEVTPRAEVSPDHALAPAVTTTSAVPVAGGSRLPVAFGLTLAGYYDDNIYVQPRGPARISDFIWTVAPSISWDSAPHTGMENSVQLSYSPAFVFYQDHPQNNTFEQAGSFLYAFHGSRSDLLLTQQYASVQNNGPDLGQLVKLEDYITTLNFDYALTTKMSLTLRAEQDIVSYDQGFDSNQWTGSAYLNFEAMPKTTFGVGALVGAADLEGPNQIFEQLNGRVMYDPTAKLSINATGGLEARQTEGRNRNLVNPVFSVGLDYDPFDSTDLNLNAYRNYSYSAKYFGDDYLGTGVSGSVTQRFFEKVYLVFTAAFEDAQYENNVANRPANLSYDFFSIRPALAVHPTDWCEVSLFYQYRENVSTTVSAFTDNQAGFESRFSY